MTMVSMAVMWAIQSTVLAVVGLLAARLLSGAPAIVRFRWYQVVLVASLLLPWVMPWALPWLVPESATGLHPSAGGGTVTSSMVGSAVDASGRGALSGLQAWNVASLAAGLWLGGVAARLLWLGLGLARLRTLRRHSRELHDPLIEGARLQTGAEAACRVSVRVARPMTWGLGRPTMLVPRRLRSLPASQREAIYVHELLHVARGDTHMVWLEEVLRAVLWFHPAVWLVVARLRLAREEVVDQATVAVTSARRPYLEALLWCAGETRSRQRPLAAVVPFFTRHQLLTRVASLTAEGTMSSARLVFGLAAAGVIVSVGALAASSLTPLPTVSGGPATQVPDPMEPGPLERVAVTPTLDVPAPRRTLAVEPEWPSDSIFAARFRVSVVVGADGGVVEARIRRQTGFRAYTSQPEQATASADEQAAMRRAALEAVRQWQFEAPALAPTLIETDIFVGDWSPTRDVLSGADPRGVPDQMITRVGGDVKAPRKAHHVPPVYPEAARAAGVQGVVIVEATLEPTGDVSDARVLRSIPLLDAAALDAVRQWKYEPTGHRLIMAMTVHFVLSE